MNDATESPTARPHFDVSGQVVTRLGSELITTSVQALLELIKNSYDADARTVQVDISMSSRWTVDEELAIAEAPDATPEPPKPDQPEQDGASEEDGGAADRTLLRGSLLVADDGHGMTSEDLVNGWLTISGSPKRAAKDSGTAVTSTLKRMPLGDKGLGRLGAQRIADYLLIRTRPTVPPRTVPETGPATAPPTEFQVAFRFSDFDRHLLTEVPVRWAELPVREAPPWPGPRPWGTVLQLCGLVSPDEWTELEQLERALGTMLDPFASVPQMALTVSLDSDPVTPDDPSPDLRQAAMTTWVVEWDEEAVTFHGSVRAENFTPRDPDVARALDEQRASDGGSAMAAVLSQALEEEGWRVTKSQPPWLVRMEKRVPLEKIPLDKSARKEAELREAIERSPSGPFRIEIDSVDLRLERMRRTGLTAFDSRAEYREWMIRNAGVAVYRDGFRVASSSDLLKLGHAFSVGGSYYGLRPANVLGAIRITAAENADLVETTDREGFMATPAFGTFGLLIDYARDEINETLEVCGRKVAAYGNSLTGKSPGRESPRSLADRARATVAAAAPLERVVELAEQALDADEDDAAGTARQAMQDVREVLAGLNDLPGVLAQMDASFAAQDEELDKYFALIGLGMVAESLVHEFDHTLERIQTLSRAILSELPEEHLARTYAEQLSRVASALAGQVSHLRPQLRARRVTRSSTDLADAVEAHMVFAARQLRDQGIDIDVVIRSSGRVRISIGRLAQILDNLLRNAAYWVRRPDAAEPAIAVVVEGSAVRVEDRGPGVPEEFVPALFEAFRHERSKGSGLGLYISRQLAERDGGSLSYLPNPEGGASFVLDYGSTSDDR